MNVKYYSSLTALSLAIILSGQVSRAGSDSHGGDVQCDALIRRIADELKTWITNQGPELGPLDLSTSRNPSRNAHAYTLPEYDSTMTAMLSRTLDPNCLSPKDGTAVYPVNVLGRDKICVNNVDESGVHITCDRSLFMGLSDDLQYQQIHHEFATNIPGLEPDFGPLSTYQISSQLSGAITTELVHRLAVKPFPKRSANDPTEFTTRLISKKGDNLYARDLDDLTMTSLVQPGPTVYLHVPSAVGYAPLNENGTVTYVNSHGQAIAEFTLENRESLRAYQLFTQSSVACPFDMTFNRTKKTITRFGLECAEPELRLEEMSKIIGNGDSWGGATSAINPRVSATISCNRGNSGSRSQTISFKNSRVQLWQQFHFASYDACSTILDLEAKTRKDCPLVLTLDPVSSQVLDGKLACNPFD